MNREIIRKRVELESVNKELRAINNNIAVVNDVMQKVPSTPELQAKSALITKLTAELHVQLGQFIKELK